MGRCLKPSWPHEDRIFPNIRRCDTGRCFENVNPLLLHKWPACKEPLVLQKAGAHLFFNGAFFFEPVIQDLIFECTCVAHCALLNFGNCCGIFHDLDHSYRRHRIWCKLGPGAWPRGERFCLCRWGLGTEGFSTRGLFSRFVLLVFLGRTGSKGGGGRKLCGTCFWCPWMKKEESWFWKVISKKHLCAEHRSLANGAFSFF